MSSFTPRSWKSQAEPQVERSAAPPVEPLPLRAELETNNLPVVRTAFIGREHDVAQVKTLLGDHGLVTLVGSGGVGKTRLAVQVGTELLGAYSDGVWLVDLAPIADQELVSSVIAQTLGMSQQEGHRVDEAIPAWLKRKKLLLILDNCEHVVDTVAPIAAAILRAAPDVRIVATSRQALGIGGEGVSRVPSLEVPHAIADLSASKVMEFAAVSLFVACAKSGDSSFVLTDDTAPIVADICRRLDGIPLAIELAAARVKVLSIPHLAERLNERFKLLTGGSRDVLPRQKTLHALIDWSYDLLNAQEQLLFTRLGIFASGFTLDAATRVCGGDGLDELDILDLLGSLTDKSLVVADTSSERERYRLLESTAAYALEKLIASGRRDALARRHAEYFRDQAVAASEPASVIVEWLAGVDLELDNFRSALTWALTQGNDPVLGGAIAGALRSLWFNGGLAVEGRYWMELALDRISEAEQPRIAAALWLALTPLSSGKRLHDVAMRAIQLYESFGDSRGAARAQRQLALGLLQTGRHDEAKATIDRALSGSRACEDEPSVANCLDTKATIARVRGEVREARELYAETLAAYRAMGEDLGTSVVLSNLAELDFDDGRAEEALRAANEAFAIQLRAKNGTNIAINHVNSAAYRIALDDLSGARASALEGLRIAQQIRHDPLVAITLQHLAVLCALDGDARRGAQLLGYVDAQYTALGMQREPTERWGYDKLLAALRDTLREDEITQLSAEGATWSEDRAVEAALKE